uniref:Cell division cycle associated 4 n=1 Tax=Gouania willdenowi TaxID=441366 RepID=A0A8C5HR11_GOUWI
MFAKGTKRKFSDPGEEPALGAELGPVVRPLSSTYSLQRQSLLDMSLIKLQLCHMLVEPNLCRSVLIANTVRQIQEEMTQDGTWQIMTQALAAAQCPADRLVATEVLCRPSEALAAAQKEEEEEEVVVAAAMEEDVDSEANPLSSSSFLPAPFGAEPGWEDEEDDSEDEDSEECPSDAEDVPDSRRGDQVFGTFEIKHPAPPPDPALEELFSDVDPSYYDLDTVLTGMQSTPKMGPYDLLDSLSPHAAPALSTGTSCRSDLNELDHIMEIIS